MYYVIEVSQNNFHFSFSAFTLIIFSPLKSISRLLLSFRLYSRVISFSQLSLHIDDVLCMQMSCTRITLFWLAMINMQEICLYETFLVQFGLLKHLYSFRKRLMNEAWCFYLLMNNIYDLYIYSYVYKILFSFIPAHQPVSSPWENTACHVIKKTMTYFLSELFGEAAMLNGVGGVCTLIGWCSICE